jgi:hypothetical protein
MAVIDKIIDFVKELIKKILSWPRSKIYIYCGLCSVVIISIILLIARPSNQSKIIPVEGQVVIPAQELFLPQEPDFLPGVLLGRQRRESWTVEDAQEYWQDPMKNGENEWRLRVEAVIDELLENIP